MSENVSNDRVLRKQELQGNQGKQLERGGWNPWKTVKNEYLANLTQINLNRKESKKKQDLTLIFTLIVSCLEILAYGILFWFHAFKLILILN